jgi:hypothetical protein
MKTRNNLFMENRKISFLVRNLLSIIISSVKIWTNNERFRNLKKRWLWWLKWRKKITMNIAKNHARRSCFSFVCYKCIYSLWLCYLAHPTHAAAEWWKERTKSNERFFFFAVFCFTINYCLLECVSIINLFLWELLPKSSFVS